MAAELEQKEWEKINRIACEFASTADYTTARRKFLQSLGSLILFDLGDFCLTAPSGAGVKLVEPVVASRFSREFEADFTLKYEKYYGELDYTRWFFTNAESVVYRESDIIDNEVRMKTPYYRDYLLPMNLIYVAGISLSENEVSLGVVALYRTQQRQDFSDRDLYILSQLLPHLRNRMIAEYKKQPPAPSDFSESQADILRLQYGLTGRESEVLRMVCQGASNAEIAQALFLTHNTVKKHVGNILAKTHARNRVELMCLMMHDRLE